MCPTCHLLWHFIFCYLSCFVIHYVLWHSLFFIMLPNLLWNFIIWEIDISSFVMFNLLWFFFYCLWHFINILGDISFNFFFFCDISFVTVILLWFFLFVCDLYQLQDFILWDILVFNIWWFLIACDIALLWKLYFKITLIAPLTLHHLWHLMVCESLALMTFYLLWYFIFLI